MNPQNDSSDNNNSIPTGLPDQQMVSPQPGMPDMQSQPAMPNIQPQPIAPNIPSQPINNFATPQNPPLNPYQQQPANPVDQQGKNYLTAFLLSLIVGNLGIDRFYLGKVGTGILKLITIGGFGIWYLYDLIMVITNSTTDKNGAKLVGYEKYGKIALIITIAWLLISVISNILIWPMLINNTNKSLNMATQSINKSVQNSNNSFNKTEIVSSIQSITDDTNLITSDINNVNSDQSSQNGLVAQDLQNMNSDCTSLNSDITSASELSPLSSLSEQTSWQAYLTKAKGVVSDCHAATSNFNGTTSATLTSDINQLNQQGISLSKQLQS